MAISLSHSYFDLPNNLTEQPPRYLQAYQFQLEMETGALAVEERQNFETENNQNNQNEQNFSGFDSVIDFVDSPPDSKEAWSTDYVKVAMHGTALIETQLGSNTTGINRKRRMEWDSIDVPTKSSHGSNELKISNLNVKEKDRKRNGPGRHGLIYDDIDLDLSGELSNNSYNISDAILFPNSNLTVFKQEIPSPTQDAQRISRSPQDPNIRQILSDTRQQHSQQQQDQQHQSSNAKSANNASNDNLLQQNQGGTSILEQQQNGNVSNINNLHQILQQQTSYEANSSPSQCESVTYRKVDPLTDDSRFQYVLAAPTSIATKNNEETLTYLNQGQSYEIKLKKLGDLSAFRGKTLKSVIKICFHERRLQYMEKEQIQQWLNSRPGERIVEVDVPLSYGLCHVSQPLNINLVNTVEVHWDPMKEVGVYIKVNCISTEFTPKKHGGEKGVPFRIQVDTYFENNQSFEGIIKPIHAAACQIKVFKLKGADRKHKQDREKIQKRPLSEQEKYQPSCECTILIDIPSESLTPQNCYSPDHSVRPTVSPILPSSPVNMAKFDAMVPYASSGNTQAMNSLNTSSSNLCKIIDQSMLSPQQVEMEEYIPVITKESTPSQLTNWLNYHRMSTHITSFANFTGTDLLRMSKDDLVQICSLPDGIRLYNILHAKAIAPKSTIYISTDSTHYHAIYLHNITTKELTQKLYKIPGLFDSTNNSINGNENNIFWGNGMQSKYSGSGSNLYDASKLTIYINGPSGIHVLLSDEVLANIKDESLFLIEIQNNGNGMQSKYSGSGSNLYDASKLTIYINGPSGIHVLLSDEVLANIKDESLFLIEIQNNGKVIMKPIYKNEINI